MRLDKFVADNTSYSRSQVRGLLKAKRIRVNGQCALVPSAALKSDDEVTLDDTLLQARSDVYLMLHKPTGYVCANTDAEHPTVFDLPGFRARYSNADIARLQIAGRLDLDTTGLVLITSDGQWNHRITSPRHKCRKAYYVECADPIATEAKSAFAEGVVLHGEKRPTLPAELELLSANTANLYIEQGIYHQVKRMFASTGNKVLRLHRFQIGPLALDNDLLPGEIRALTSDEIRLLNNA
ncbi:16S rRNA pseudouridine(516) synthase [Teredinibacter turnerae]|uniref:16S rRNA pseudouridine(516) synthase n=1 Tax=Teredinibacter turnerae TaxID=2426 RepID=UPI0004227031|nr:pseudouridine synthase [Teredinibacter turnerae]